MKPASTQLKNLDHFNAFLHVPNEPLVSLSSGRLAGITVAVKDNIAVEGMPLTCGSKLLGNFISPYNATAVAQILDVGAAIVGKTNMDEFGMGSSCEYSAFGHVLNPLDHTRVPGGSSGGSAAAVAAGLCDVALGSDTGGSVRQPAAFCGVYGFKPTYGRISRYGLVAFASSLDQVGILSADLNKLIEVAENICGYDINDNTTSRKPIPKWSTDLEKNVQGLRIGVPQEYLDGIEEKECRQVVDNAIEQLKAGGATCESISLPLTPHVLPTYYIINTAEASSNLSRFDGGRFGNRTPANRFHDMVTASRDHGFGEEVKRRILLGTYVLSKGYYDQYFDKATKVRMLIRNEFMHHFSDGIDLLLTPTTPTRAFRFGEKSKPLTMYGSDRFTAAASLAGLPAISVPMPVDGLLAGVQLIAPHFREDLIFRSCRYLSYY
ncbi:Asp-tRNA(Asn)/Glu-tRNA(Gln) amidotransferase subunit GatA [bacterium]|nr:Asp-tRNA(Asn)/Glu-tRNA(Gln) amidotransferase subunit GatA [bacterium]